MSFVDETTHVKEKAKVMKRNRQLNIRNTRLRKTLQNDKLLNNYFEFAVSNNKHNNDLTVYKMVDTQRLEQQEVSNGNMEETNRVVTSKVPIKANMLLSNPCQQLSEQHVNISNNISLTCSNNNSFESVSDFDQQHASIQNNTTCSNIGEHVPSTEQIYSNEHSYSNQAFMQNEEYSGNSRVSFTDNSLDFCTREEDLGFLTYSWFDTFAEFLHKETNLLSNGFSQNETNQTNLFLNFKL
ncbi:predicted protein [Naegleria gruberi]|uniref:Predicted protein n=1 Tax=Naegleria gruberi TaxID=5762 RepID=D2VFA2_NAEGR|nr:uncharacterized protein NAEGRDRAFT_67553 [Naegleria gruberi]EFC44424.1 predicted protein [Naegleria gruberi]|eukprot:XP_002677168.1 predicted protein [Naegleria gruberi strain NEG-M]